MTNEEILGYIANTPENTNLNVVRSLMKTEGSSVIIEALSVAENGTYRAEEGTAYNPVTVSV